MEIKCRSDWGKERGEKTDIKKESTTDRAAETKRVGRGRGRGGLDIQSLFPNAPSSVHVDSGPRAIH